MQGILDRIESLDLRTMTEECLRGLMEEFKLADEYDFVVTTLADEGWMWYDVKGGEDGEWRRDSRPTKELPFAGRSLQTG